MALFSMEFVIINLKLEAKLTKRWYIFTTSSQKTYFCFAVEQKYDQILKNIEEGQYAPVYWLEGEETFFIDDISERIESSVLKEEEKDFNQVILYGKEVDFKQVVDQARQFPMMAAYRVVLLREAQDMRDISSLETYIKQPSRQCVLVVQHKYRKIRKTGDLGKALKKNAVVFNAKRLYDNQIPSWIVNRGKEKKLSIRPEAATLISELVGSNLSKIEAELDKLRVVMGKEKEVSFELVNEYIGQSKEFNAFELNNALGIKDSAKAFRIIEYFIANPKSAFPPAVIGSLTNYFSRIWITQENSSSSDQNLADLLKMNSTYFLRDYRQAAKHYPRAKLMQIFEVLEEYDLRIKGVNSRSTTNGELLKELVFKILH
jgi:DNA polymerase-3 subunit delta